MRLPALVPALAVSLSLAPLAPAAAAPQTVVVLVTGDENGHLFPSTDGDAPKGGAAETLGFWTSKDGHCPGKLGKSPGWMFMTRGQPREVAEGPKARRNPGVRSRM